eukprot:828536-Amphidinium_carterae.1
MSTLPARRCAGFPQTVNLRRVFSLKTYDATLFKLSCLLQLLDGRLKHKLSPLHVQSTHLNLGHGRPTLH